jgi:hypothetical protein
MFSCRPATEQNIERMITGNYENGDLMRGIQLIFINKPLTIYSLK